MPKIVGGEHAVAGVIPRFFMNPVLNKSKSKAAGHAIYDDVEYVEVTILGSRSTRPVYRVTDKYREKWPKHYKAFREGTEYIEEGYRLSEWSQMTPAGVESLRQMGIHTMEQFIDLNEDTSKYLGLFQLRHEARKILAGQDEKQMAIDKLQEQNEMLIKRLEALEKKPAKKKREISPETKAKMAEGRARAAAAKKQAQEVERTPEE